ncbi:ARM repeat superfamily protein [Striga hermonthica]|uniref:ARM repeat superfamily protein n=1 Tax=Striga hermonthica TaxID=68872 RepID=A0A9N7NSM6_STRHE|nr:ARM repeat superfamily protein [Striga hermonthica]
MNCKESRPIPLPDNLLEPLYVASGTSNLSRACECLIEAAKTPDGRLDLASRGILLSVLELCRYPHQLSRHDLILSLKLLRNLCAGEIINQNSFIDQNGAEILATLVSSLGLITGSDDGLLPLVLQVLGNVPLAGEHQRVAVWRQFFPHKFLDIAKVQRKETCDPLCMVIYVCTEGSNERSLELFADAGQYIIVEILQTVTKAGFRQDWVKLLLSRICIEEPCFPSIFSKLSRVAEAVNSSEVNSFGPEKEFLLRILSDILNERVGDIVVSGDFSLCIFEIFKSALGVVDFSKRGNSSIPTGSTDIDVMGFTLSILKDITACNKKVTKEDEKEDNVDKLVAAGLVKFLLDVLRGLEPPTTIRKATINSDDARNETTSRDYKYCPYRGFRRDIVAVIGNCSYRKKHVQDEVREQCGILLLLQQCVTDEENPFLREWGIFSMRNILEGNIENQRLVTDLELQQTVDSPEISKLGLRVEVDPTTRRPKLINTS